MNDDILADLRKMEELQVSCDFVSTLSQKHKSPAAFCRGGFAVFLACSKTCAAGESML